MISKICCSCNNKHPIDYFHKSNQTRDGRRSSCKVCRNKYLKEWKKRNPEKVRAQKYRHRYGIDLDDYNILLNKQGYKCKICSSKSPGRGKYFYVDHDHTAGNIRGLLCDNCNKGLGHFKDNLNTLLSAINYLKN